MIRKILFIPLSNIGDAVMTIPTLLYLKKIYPFAKFDLICDQRSVEIFQYFPSINEIFIRDKSAVFIDQLIFFKKIRKNNYDLAIDLKTDILLWFVRAKSKIFKSNNKSVHSVEKHFLSCESDFNKIPDPKIFIPINIENKLSKLLQLKRGKTIAIALGANSVHKIWPIANYVKLLKLLRNKFKNIILVGSKNDVMQALSFEKLYDQEIINLCGVLTLLESAAAIKKSDFFIGNDSGLGHIASAVGTKSFTIFGDGQPNRYRPWGIKSNWYQNIEKDINLITADTIFKELKKILN